MVEETKTGTGLFRKSDAVADTHTNLYYRRIKIVRKVVSHVILALFALFAIFPIYYVVMTSLSPLNSIVVSTLSNLIPSSSNITFSNYYQLLYQEPYELWLKNTLILTTGGTILGVLLSLTSGFALSRLGIPGTKALLYFLLILSLFPFTIMVIPFYFMFAKLHLLNTYIGLIIPYSAGAAIYSAYLIKNYVDRLPPEVEEAAQLDGYTRTGAMFRCLMPMARPVIIFAAVLSFMGPYTDYALAGQFISSPKLYTLAMAMYYVSQGDVVMHYGVYAAFSVLMGIPIFILFFVFQKYLVSGFSISTYK